MLLPAWRRTEREPVELAVRITQFARSNTRAANVANEIREPQNVTPERRHRKHQHRSPSVPRFKNCLKAPVNYLPRSSDLFLDKTQITQEIDLLWMTSLESRQSQIVRVIQKNQNQTSHQPRRRFSSNKRETLQYLIRFRKEKSKST